MIAGQEEKGAKFSDYFDHREPWPSVASHRALAMLRASKEEVVTLDIAPDPEIGSARAAEIIASHIGIPRQRRRVTTGCGTLPTGHGA